MGFRFRKSINLGGGARLNFSKSGIGFSFGTKGARVTKKAGGGTRTTLSVPGTGISYVEDSKQPKKTSSKRKSTGGQGTGMNNSGGPKKKTWLWVLGWLCIFPLPLTILLLRKKEMKPPVKYGIIAASWILYFIIGFAGSAGKNSRNVSGNGSSNITELSFLRKDEQKVKIGKSTTESYVNVRVKNKDAFSSSDVQFISENPEIATIDFTKEALSTYIYYRITGVSAGETYVYAASTDGGVQSEKLKVIVEGSGENITALAFSNSAEVTVKVGRESEIGTLNVSMKSAWGASQDDIVLISENPDVALINLEKFSGNKATYKIKGISPGKTAVYAQSNDGIVSSGKVSVVVPEPINVESINFDFENKTLGLGESFEPSVVVMPENADDETLKWSSSDPSLVTVNPEGRVLALKEGEAVITAEAVSGASSSFVVNVDGSRRVMGVRVTHPRDDDNNIGDQWSFTTEIDGENVSREYAVSVGQTLKLHAKFTEEDDSPDVGEASKSYTVTKEDVQNGFTVPMDLYVRENGGRNSGKSAHFIVTYTFTPK